MIEKKISEALRRARERITDDEFARKLYDALCNRLLYGSEAVQYTWKEAAEIIVDMRGFEESFMYFYHSGNEYDVDPEIKKIFDAFGIGLERPDDKYEENKSYLVSKKM
ncbi:MAG: hypothetical protein ACTSRA_00710 [Promethearchaeota archaeon]|nr:MAG: hypothetical protein [Helarchaeota virus Nidhogg Meg22_1012]URC17479.1 MAG: hypothetical protein [Helarchaeota virus Nidhogg Meg22_1214]